MAQVVVTTTSLPDAVVGQPYEAAIAVTGFSVAGNVALAAGTTQTGKDALPAGLSYSGGRIVGTPTAPATVQPYRPLNLSIKVSNSAGTDTAADNQAFTLNLNYPSAAQAAQADAATNKELPVATDLARKNLGV